MKGNEDPKTSPQNTAFSAEESQVESEVVGGAHVSAAAQVMRQLADLSVSLSAEDALRLKVAGILRDESIPASARIAEVSRLLAGTKGSEAILKALRDESVPEDFRVSSALKTLKATGSVGVAAAKAASAKAAAKAKLDPDSDNPAVEEPPVPPR